MFYSRPSYNIQQISRASYVLTYQTLLVVWYLRWKYSTLSLSMNFALIMFITIIFLQHFWENNIKRYCHSTDLKNKGGSLCLYGSLHVINLNAHVYFQSFAWHLQLRSPPLPPPRLFPLKQRQSPACFSHEISMDSADPLP